jgi:hypothetical protein
VVQQDLTMCEAVQGTYDAGLSAIVERDDPTEQLEYMIDAYLPSPRRDQSWALWIDVWGEALRDPEVRRISEELDDGWVDVFAQVITAGVESGAFAAELELGYQLVGSTRG